jgi:hypothetical protein
MLIKVLKTYRGGKGLLIQGHPYDLPEPVINAIAAECSMRKEKFEYEIIKNPRMINRPAKKKQVDASSGKQEQYGGAK